MSNPRNSSCLPTQWMGRWEMKSSSSRLNWGKNCPEIRRTCHVLVEWNTAPWGVSFRSSGVSYYLNYHDFCCPGSFFFSFFNLFRNRTGQGLGLAFFSLCKNSVIIDTYDFLTNDARVISCLGNVILRSHSLQEFLKNWNRKPWWRYVKIVN